jgi:hypothetical protein
MRIAKERSEERLGQPIVQWIGLTSRDLRWAGTADKIGATQLREVLRNDLAGQLRFI